MERKGKASNRKQIEPELKRARPQHFKIEHVYRVVQLSFAPDIKVSYILRSFSIFSMTSLKQHLECFHFRFKIQLDLPVDPSDPDDDDIASSLQPAAASFLKSSKPNP